MIAEDFFLIEKSENFFDKIAYLCSSLFKHCMQEDTMTSSQQERVLIEKIRMLAPEKIAEVEDFVNFLRLKDQERKLLRASNRLSEDAFRKVWDNPEDDAYDGL